ncbi:MAG TPA: peptidoglycan DD-metalloendopeptidase family protein [Azonexus sp.]|nr:peptidoglycan DD-metalloendopeptidase family protein [Azonexus sp.]
MRSKTPALPMPLAAVFIFAALLGSPSGYAQPARDKARAAPASPEITERQADLSELRQRIESLRKDLSVSEENKASAADRLGESERQISRLQRELHDLGGQRGQLQKKLQDLEQQSKELSVTLTQQQGQLEKLLYKQYLRGTPDSLQLQLNGDDPNQMARDLYYLSAIALTRAELMGEVSATLGKKKALVVDIKERADELREIEAQQQRRHAELQKQREERNALYTQVSDKVNAQRKQIGFLQQDERRLTELIDRLSKILATQAAKAAREAEAARARATEAARIAEAARLKEKEKPRSRPSEEAREAPRPAPTSEPVRPKAVESESRYEPVASDGSFARQKGNLRLPVRGSVSGRFGSPREGGGTWRGLFIKAGVGSDVKAIAGGRVVFAEWMRGFGNLLIVDHGDSYLSIYGNNDSLLKQVGQSVKGGETVATVGNSGGNPDSGLYFELRHQGQPIDPMKWASLK